MSEATLQAIRDTLREKFPGAQISDNYQGAKRAQSFKIERGGRLVHHLFIARELLDARRQTALSTIFDRFEIVKALEEAGAREVSVNSRGVTVQKSPAPAAPAAPAPAREPDTREADPVFRFVPPAPAPSAEPAVEAPAADPIMPPAPEPPPPLPVTESPEAVALASPEPEPPPTPPEPPPPPPVAEPPVAAAVVPPAPEPPPPAPPAPAPPGAPSDAFADALGLIRELRQSLQGIDDGVGQGVRDIDADLAEAEANVADAQARVQRATAQLTELVASLDTVVSNARAGLDRVRKRSR